MITRGRIEEIKKRVNSVEHYYIDFKKSELLDLIQLALSTFAENNSENSLDEGVRNIIQEWLFYWMNQKQNSEKDYKNYLHRAMGVDANMRHHLKNKLVDFICAHVLMLAEENTHLRNALQKTRGQWIHSVNAQECLKALGEKN